MSPSWRRRRLRALLGFAPEDDVGDELAFHIEMRMRELIERGETPERARELALRRFGDYEASREACVAINERRGRRMARSEHLRELKQDIRYALRALGRRPGFAVVAVLTLGLGIGANSAIFSVVNAVLLRSLPYRDAEQLWELQMIYPDGTAYGSLSAPDFMSVAEESRVFDEVAAHTGTLQTLLARGEAKEARAALVSRDYFRIIGMPLALGRGFAPEEHTPGGAGAAVLDHGFWQREFGGDRGVVGRSLDIAGEPYTIVGVLEEGAGMRSGWDLYRPLSYGETFSATTATGRRGEFLRVLGRARPGVTEEAIRADVGRLGAELQERFPDTNGRLTFGVESFREQVVGDVRGPLLVLLGAVGFVLLVACANVANLLLARASARQGELAVRSALGAGRGRLVRQLLTESVILGVAGGALGLALAWAGTRALVAAQPAEIPRLDEVGVDATVVLFTLAVSVGTGLLFGLIPGLQVTGGRLVRALREGGRGALGGGGQRLRSGLIVAEIALAVVLLVGAGLLVRSFVELTRVDTGFTPEQAMTFRVALQGSSYQESQQSRDFHTTLRERLLALPGVREVGGTTTLPLQGLGSILGPFAVEGREPPPNVNSEIVVASITPSYFQAVGAAMVRGRPFAGSEGPQSPPVGILNQAAVRRWFDGADPVGRRVLLGGEPVEIVGMVRDVLQEDPGSEPAAQLFLPYTQRTTRSLNVVVRTAGDPLALAGAVRRTVAELDPNLAIARVTPLSDIVAESVARPRFYTSLLALFAGVALALAAIGIFGVMSYTVAQRAREISVRIALGAQRGAVVRMIVGRAMALSALGLLLGGGAALALGRVIRSQLYGVEPMDPLTLAAVVVVLGGSAGVASWLPARRAARLDPGGALRQE
ncbi:MAG TPA: ABC transporter permease [Longimicrobiales bacterium]|nr:ABC transporter permease [Longimicrobiales bacterium]